MSRYSRADLLRILRLTARQLAAWEKAELVAVSESYSFFDLLQIKKIRDLCALKVRPAIIRQSLAAMQKQVAGMENPLLEAGAFTTGHRVAFRHQGKLVEPIAGQFMFDFVPSAGTFTHTVELKAVQKNARKGDKKSPIPIADARCVRSYSRKASPWKMIPIISYKPLHL